jgi:hypothetical protein
MGDKGRTGSFFDDCSPCQVSAWPGNLRRRTTLDILNAQHARVALVTAQHDGVAASHTLLAAQGGPLKVAPQRDDLRSPGSGVPNPDERPIDGAVRAVSHFVKILS